MAQQGQTGAGKNPYLEQMPAQIPRGGAYPLVGAPPRPVAGSDQMNVKMGGGRARMDPTQANEYHKRLQQAMMASQGQFQGQGGAPMMTAVYQRGGPAGAYAAGGPIPQNPALIKRRG